MKDTRVLMGMPITVDIVDDSATAESLEKIFAYFRYVDETFSTYKETSEISAINRHELTLLGASEDMKEVFALAEETKKETNGYFDIVAVDGKYDPSGLVKGWSIQNAASLLKEHGFKNFYIEAGGDIAVSGHSANGTPWSVGIKNPWNRDEIVKVIYLRNMGVATSGNYIRGDHIYNPHDREKTITDIVSLTVIGPTVYDADRFATAAFAMGREGIYFLEKLSGYEAYMIDKDKVSTQTNGFDAYTTK